jgi:hypothetical protein
MQNTRIMMLYRALLVLLVTLSGAVTSEISLRGGEEDSSEVTSTNNRDLNGKQVGVPGCKRKGRDRHYEPTTLPDIYRLPGDSVPSKTGYGLDETCQIVPVFCPCFTAESFSDVVNTEDCGPKTCINDAPIFAFIYKDWCFEGGCSGYNCGSPWTPGAPDELSCDFRPDFGSVHVHFNRITNAENEACQTIIIKEMFNCVPPV